jgi:hypothetical protein
MGELELVEERVGQENGALGAGREGQDAMAEGVAGRWDQLNAGSNSVSPATTSTTSAFASSGSTARAVPVKRSGLRLSWSSSVQHAHSRAGPGP